MADERVAALEALCRELKHGLKDAQARLRAAEDELNSRGRYAVGLGSRVDRLDQSVFVNGAHSTTLRGEVSRLDAEIGELKKVRKIATGRLLEWGKLLFVAALAWLGTRLGVDPEFLKGLTGG